MVSPPVGRRYSWVSHYSQKVRNSSWADPEQGSLPLSTRRLALCFTKHQTSAGRVKPWPSFKASWWLSFKLITQTEHWASWWLGLRWDWADNLDWALPLLRPPQLFRRSWAGTATQHKLGFVLVLVCCSNQAFLQFSVPSECFSITPQAQQRKVRKFPFWFIAILLCEQNNWKVGDTLTLLIWQSCCNLCETVNALYWSIGSSYFIALVNPLNHTLGYCRYSQSQWSSDFTRLWSLQNLPITQLPM